MPKTRDGCTEAPPMGATGRAKHEGEGRRRERGRGEEPRTGCPVEGEGEKTGAQRRDRTRG